MKKFLAISLAVVMVLGLAACGGKEETKAASNTNINDPANFDRSAVTGDLLLGTAAQGGTWYVLGAAIADAVNQASGMDVSPATTGGTCDNIRLLHKGDLDIGMSQPPAEYQASVKTDLFEEEKEAITDIRWISGGHYSKSQLIVWKDSPYNTFKDLLGKKIAYGAPGSGARNVTGRGTLLANGYDLEDFDVLNLNNAQGAEQLQDGAIDAAHVSGGLGNSTVRTLASVKPIRIMSTTQASIDNLAKTKPEWVAAMKLYTVPAGMYATTQEEAHVIGFISTFLVRAEQKDEVVYAWLDYFAELSPTLTSVAADAAEYTMENISAGRCIEAHPAAVKWFADHGVTVK